MIHLHLDLYRKVLLLIASSLILLLCSCTTSPKNDVNEQQVNNKNLETETNNHNNKTEEVIDSTSVQIDNLSSDYLDSLRLNYQEQLDTGNSMYETVREEYLLLTKLKDQFVDDLEKGCLKKLKENTFKLKVDKWNASIDAVMNEQKKEFADQGPEHEWGKDYHMIVYSAGVDQLYLFLKDLIVMKNDWCD